MVAGLRILTALVTFTALTLSFYSLYVLRFNNDGQPESWSNVIEKRQFRVKEMCKRLNLYKTNPNVNVTKKSFMVDKNNRLAYCRIAKAGTTSIMEIFSKLSNITIPTRKPPRIHTVVPNFFKFDERSMGTASKFQNYTRHEDILSFAFVRHPFDRLVSTFENKVLFTEYHNLRHKLNGSFTNFINMVIEDHDNCTIHDMDEQCHIDKHWRRFVDRCHFCDIDYDLIGTVETFEEDIIHLLKVKNLTDFVDIVPKSNSMPHNESRTKVYFDQLSRDQKSKLLDIFKIDFDLFGYEASSYM